MYYFLFPFIYELDYWYVYHYFELDTEEQRIYVHNDTMKTLTEGTNEKRFEHLLTLVME